MPSNRRVHYWDEYDNEFLYRVDTPTTDEYLSPRDQSSSSSLRSGDSSFNSDSSDEIKRQIYSVASQLLQEDLKNLTLKSSKKTKNAGCQVTDSSLDPVFLDEYKKIKHENDDYKNAMEYYKDKCQKQEVLLAQQNLKLADNEEIINELTSFFNTKIDQLKEEFEVKARSLIIQGSTAKVNESIVVQNEPYMAQIKTELKFYEEDNRRLRKEMNQMRLHEGNSDIINAQINSRIKERDQKWRMKVFDFCQGLKTRKSFRRKSAE